MKYWLLIAAMLVVPEKGSEAKDTLACPARLALVGGSDLAREITATTRKIYRALGCQTELVSLAGRRGTAAFQKGEVDGVVMRVPDVEKTLGRTFVRSGVPLLTFHRVLWKHPDKAIFDSRPTGFTMGVVWQDHWVRAETEKGDREIIPYGSEDALFAALKSGKIGSLLSETPSLILRGRELPELAQASNSETLGAMSLYHYLGADYAPFMERFTAYLEANRPFRHLQR